jgi:uncharacterized protein (DUF2249 family)
MEKLIITPKTKIYDLLQSYPQLEDVLIALAPPFKKLKNPVLRRTITKITNLNQAATIGGLNVEELVNTLRKEIGQESISELSETETQYQTDRPAWFDEKKVVNSIDIRDMLHAGEQPVFEVLSAIKKLGDGELLEVIAPFIPAPLLDKSLSLNYRHWLKKESDEKFVIYFGK